MVPPKPRPLSKIAQQLGSAGGKARAARMSKEERSEAARAAVKERWRRHHARLQAGESESEGA